MKLVDMKFKSLKGTFLGFSEEAISLRVNGDEVVVERAKVLRVASRDHPNRRRGAVVGMVVGLGAGGGVGAAIAKGWRGYFDLHRTPWEVAVGGAVIGLGAGAALGAPFPPYQTIYRTKKPEAAKVP